MTIQGSRYSVDGDIHSNSTEEIVRSISAYLKNDGHIGINDFIRNCEQYDVDFVATFSILGGSTKEK